VWARAASDGVRAATGLPLAAGDLECAFYGNLFRGTGTAAPRALKLTEHDARDPLEVALLEQWAAAAAAQSPEVDAMGRGRYQVGRALDH
jgi:hypothetical protein